MQRRQLVQWMAGAPLLAGAGLGAQDRPLPYLAYAPGAYLGSVSDWMLRQARSPVHLDRVYETDMAEGLKAMALEGHGLAFLPQSAVKKELQTGALAEAVLPDGKTLALTMEVRAYREKPGPRSKRSALELWDYLAARGPVLALGGEGL